LLESFGRYEEAISLLRKSIPLARRVFGETKITTLRMRWVYALVLYRDKGATLADIHKAVETLESVARSWKLVFGEAHPETPIVRAALEEARKVLAARAA